MGLRDRLRDRRSTYMGEQPEYPERRQKEQRRRPGILSAVLGQQRQKRQAEHLQAGILQLGKLNAVRARVKDGLNQSAAIHPEEIENNQRQTAKQHETGPIDGGKGGLLRHLWRHTHSHRALPTPFW